VGRSAAASSRYVNRGSSLFDRVKTNGCTLIAILWVEAILSRRVSGAVQFNHSEKSQAKFAKLSNAASGLPDALICAM
jgi:hypothetical protein